MNFSLFFILFFSSFSPPIYNYYFFIFRKLISGKVSPGFTRYCWKESKKQMTFVCGLLPLIERTPFIPLFTFFPCNLLSQRSKTILWHPTKTSRGLKSRHRPQQDYIRSQEFCRKAVSDIDLSLRVRDLHKDLTQQHRGWSSNVLSRRSKGETKSTTKVWPQPPWQLKLTFPLAQDKWMLLTSSGL